MYKIKKKLHFKFLFLIKGLRVYCLEFGSEISNTNLTLKVITIIIQVANFQANKQQTFSWNTYGLNTFL